MSELGGQLVGGLFGLLLLAAVACWLRIVSRQEPIDKWMTFSPRQPVPWGLFDLGLVVVLFFAGQGLVLAVMVSTGAALEGTPLDPGSAAVESNGVSNEPDRTEPAADPNDSDPPSTNDSGRKRRQHPTAAGLSIAFLANSLATILVLLLAIVAIRVRCGATSTDLGWSSAFSKGDLVTGVVAFLMVAGPTFLVQMIATFILEPKDEHPLITMLREDNRWSLFALAAFSAVIVAPVAEEFLFRVFFQGWLENVANQRWLQVSLMFGSSEPPQFAQGNSLRPNAGIADATLGEPQKPQDVTPVLAEPGAVNPYQPPPILDAERQPDQDMASPVKKPRWWPIFVSSLLFAGMHVGHGADPIPLFFLALALGYLYQQTHRVLPCIILHMPNNYLPIFQR